MKQIDQENFQSYRKRRMVVALEKQGGKQKSNIPNLFREKV